MGFADDVPEAVTAPDIEQVQVLDSDGTVVDEERLPDLSDDQLLDLYRYMVLGRTADEKFFKLQRQGRFGTFAPCRGQEAAQVGSAYVLDEADWMFPAFRETAAWPVRDLSITKLVQYWQGDERGMQLEDTNDFPFAVPVGTQVPHAAGCAWASKLRGEDSATLVYFGDGATSEGDFHEGMNFAGTFDLPVVFLCQNNQYAISVPVERQTGSDSLAQKAAAYGFPGVQVDGNDVLAMYQVTREALQHARDGDGPVMIEAFTYRLGDHTTSDDASRYRDDDEVEAWRERDPIDRFEAYLRDEGLLDDDTIEDIREDAKEQVNDAVDAAEAMEDPSPADMVAYLYDEMPPRLERQLERLEEQEA